MLTFSTIGDLEAASLKDGDVVRVLGEFKEGDSAVMQGRVRPQGTPVLNRVVELANGKVVEIFPTPAVAASREFVEGVVHDFHTEDAHPWPASSQITSAVYKIKVAGEYYVPSAVPFMTNDTWEGDKHHWIKMDTVKAIGSTTSRSLQERFADVVNVKDFGAVGDGVTDDTAAIQAASVVAIANNKPLLFPFGSYRVTSTVTFDYNDGINHSIIMEGSIIPDAGIGNALEIIRVRDSEFKLKVVGGGQLSDFSVVGANPDQAFYIRAVRSSKIDVLGSGYKGRVLRTEGNLSTEIIKTSLNTINVTTGDQGGGQTERCGQAFWLQGSDSGFGILDKVILNWDEYGPVCEKLVDTTLIHGECGFGKLGGWRWLGCAGIWINSLAAGDETYTNDILSFLPHSDGTLSRRISADRLFLLRGARGLVCGANEPTESGYDFNAIYTIANSTVGTLLTDVRNSRIEVYSQRDKKGLELAKSCNHNTIWVDVYGSDTQGIHTTGNSNNIFFSGSVRNAWLTGSASDGYAVDVASSNRLSFTNMEVECNPTVGKAYLFPVGSNDNKVIGGSITNAGAPFGNTTPNEIFGVSGYITENRGTSKVNSSTGLIVPHGLPKAPSVVTCTPHGNAHFWVESIDSTNVVFRTTTTVNMDLSWRVSV